MHQNDLLYALDWAIRKAEAEGGDDARLMLLPALRELRDMIARGAYEGVQ